MLLSISFVPVRQITSNIPRSQFSDDEINRVADLILKGEGIINPLILHCTSLDSYEVVDGHFEYYAATRAREIDLRKGEMIGAFIVDNNNKNSIEEQIKLLRNRKEIAVHTTELSNLNVSESRLINMESRTTNTEARLINLESRFETRTHELQQELKREIKNITHKINEISSHLPRQIEPLEALNTLSSSELTSRLRRVNVKQKIITSIINEQKKGKFKSFSDVVERIDGLGEKTMLKIIDSFTEVNI